MLQQLERKEKWYEHLPEGVVENSEVKLPWDMNIQCDNVVEARRHDIIVVSKNVKKCIIVQIVGYMKRNLKKFKNIRI